MNVLLNHPGFLCFLRQHHSFLRGLVPVRTLYFYCVQLIAPKFEDSVQVLAENKPFLITSTGRTGTKLLAGMLNEIPDVHAVHEPVPEEQFYHMTALMNPETSLSYIRKFRIREMAYRIKKIKCSRYGEINGCLRRHLSALKEVIPFMKRVHLIRDGRNVVSSMLNRRTLTPEDRIYYKMIPPKEDMNPAEWKRLDRFQKICWMWAYENRHMRKGCDFSVRFEDLISEYGYMKENLLIPLDLSLDLSIWKTYASHPINESGHILKKNLYPNWSRNEKKYFWKVCGPEMERFQYTIDAQY